MKWFWNTRKNKISPEERTAAWIYEYYERSLEVLYAQGMPDRKELTTAFAFHFYITSTFMLDKQLKIINQKQKVCSRISSHLKGRLIMFTIERSANPKTLRFSDAELYVNVIFNSEKSKLESYTATLPKGQLFDIVEVYATLASNLLDKEEAVRINTKIILKSIMRKLTEDLQSRIPKYYRS